MFSLQSCQLRTATLDDLTRAFRLDPADHASGRSAVIAALTLAADAGNDELAVGYYGRAVEIADEMATASPDYENTLLAGRGVGEGHGDEVIDLDRRRGNDHLPQVITADFGPAEPLEEAQVRPARDAVDRHGHGVGGIFGVPSGAPAAEDRR